jgi:hypothetical protein
MKHGIRIEVWLLVLGLVGAVGVSPVRAQGLLTHHGDTISPVIESVYVKGLAYLVSTQTATGGWPDSNGSQPGVIGLAVLAMLGHGDDPNFGPHSMAIKRGLNAILTQANPENGYLGSTMYNHGFATLALAEAYGTVNDPRLGPALKKAVGLILTSQAQNPTGAWRYSPESRNADTTVSGAQMVALYAARNAGLHVPQEAIEQGLLFYRRAQSGDGGFGYTSAGSANAIRTAIGSLVFALGHQKDSSEFKRAFRYLQQGGGDDRSKPYYYMYYASQAYFHADASAWSVWNAAHVKVLAETQNADGSWNGSNGATFSTSAALLSLALNYRLLPIYER